MQWRKCCIGPHNFPIPHDFLLKTRPKVGAVIDVDVDVVGAKYS